MQAEFDYEDNLAEERQGRIIVWVGTGITLFTLLLLAYGLFFLA